MSHLHSPSKSRTGLVFALYYVTLLAFLLASFFPEYRLWGINWWAYFPHYVPFILFAIGVVAPLVLLTILRSEILEGRRQLTGSQSNLTYILCVVVLTSLYGLTFYFMRTRTHFLGDGYQLLTHLADRAPSVKAWDMGTSFVNDGLFSLLSGQPDVRALMTFRIISVASGVALLVAVAFLSRALFDRNLQRYLFLLGLVSGGYMLLFFGYVENYALFIVAVMLYTLVGVAVAKGKVSRWWVLPPLLVTLFLHLFGVALLPSLFYLLLRDSRFGRWLGNLSTKTKLVMAAVLVLLAVSIYYYLYTSYYFFTFALLPMVPDRFTIEDDWLFSLKHVTDICNLLMLLVPGLPILLTVVFVSPVKGWLRRADYRFLLILTLSTLGAVYIFNPGIGMPRNWDLFSIAGLPLVVLCYYYALEHRRSGRSALLMCVPAIVLGFLSLAPRVATQVVPGLGVAHFKNYLVLDKIRNRNAWRLLIDYHRRRGDTLSAQDIIRQRLREFPELQFNAQAQALMNEGRYAEALAPARMAIQLDPVYWSAYHNLGASYYQLKQFDSAEFFLEIANGLNPFNAETLALLGGVQLHKGNYRQAKKYIDRSFHIDSGLENAIVGLVCVHRSIGQFERSFEYLTRLYDLNLVTSDFFREAGDFYLHKGKYGLAAGAYTYAVDRGLDSSYVDSLRVGFPQLRNWIK